MASNHIEDTSTDITEEETVYLEFVKDRIKRYGGTILLQHLPGHFSQLPFNVRNAVGTSQTDVTKFLRKHSNVFNINNKGSISLSDSSTKSSQPKCDSSSSSSISSGKPSKTAKENDALPSVIKNGEGVIYRLLASFGFMNIIKPKINEAVYFTGQNFQEKETILSKFDLQHGQVLHFNATRANGDFDAKYRALQVWIPNNSKTVTCDNSLTNPRKSRKTGLYDPMTLENEGFIQNIFPKSGFIEVSGDPGNTVYFNLSTVCKYDNLVDLTKIMKKGDHVEFSAIRSTKKGVTARWEATKVWIKKNKMLKLSSKNVDEEISESETNIHLRHKKLSTESKVVNGTSSHNDDENRLVNKEGKICIRTSGVVIKFGDSQAELADADSSLFYLYETKVTDIAWEFSDGDRVNFDAIRIKSTPGWKAVLVWVGTKPNVVVPNFAGEFGEFTDEEIEVTAENDTYDSVNANKSKSSTRKDLSHAYVESSNKHLPGFQKTHSSKKFLPSFNESRSSKSNLALDSDVLGNEKWKSDSDRYSSRESSHTPSSPDSSANYKSRTRSRTSSKSSKVSNASSKPIEEQGKNIKDGVKTSHNYGGFSSWGDSPYPDEDKVTDPVNETIDLELDNTVDVENKELQSSNNLNLSEKHFNIIEPVLEINNKCQPILKDESKYSSAIFNNESFFKENVEDSPILKYVKKKNELLSQNKEKNPENNNKINLTASTEKPKIISYKKKLEHISGTILKIYSRFAEIKCDQLHKPVAFFLSDFYRNGVSIDVHFDDLREVLKVGDEIAFDCIEIIDDNGNCWQKVTVAWKGEKPKIKSELTPEKFIEDNGLKVTIVCETLQDDRMKRQKDKHKFLTEKHNDDDINTVQSLNISTHDDEVFRHTTTEDKSLLPETFQHTTTEDKNLLPETFQHTTTEDKNLLPETKVWPSSDIISVPNLENIKNKVCEILIHRGFEKSDLLDVACKEVTHFLYNALCNTEPELLTKTSEPSTSKSANHTRVDQRSQAIQTFITGDVVSQNIYPH